VARPDVTVDLFPRLREEPARAFERAEEGGLAYAARRDAS
jgi:hypothetical protein